MEYLERMCKIQDHILEFLDDNDNDQQKFDNFESLLKSYQPKIDKHELKSILYLISNIAKNHHRCLNFFDKIKKIISLYQKEIKTFTNIDIFNIFKKNKLIILIIIEEEIITLDQEIITKITENENYKTFFLPEIQQIQQNDEFKEIPSNFKEKRRNGENDSYICELIRNDNVVDFIAFINKQNISLQMKIAPSIYETNSFLLKNTPTLIEYSAFCGSVNLFDYLLKNGAELKPSLFLFAIHGNNPEIIYLLEENDIKCDDQIYYDCFKESIKCHHKDFELYYKTNFINDIDVHSNYYENEISYGFHFYNFNFIPKNLEEPFCFFYAVEYDYYKLVALEKNNLDIFKYLLQLPDIRIDDNCFQNCTKLIQFTIPPNITSIGYHSFYSCTNLEKIIIPSSVTSIGEKAFSYCKKLTEIILPPSVVYIGDDFVLGCKSLRKIVIPQDIKNIGILNFKKFSLLKEFKIPKSVTSIVDEAFYGCKSLVNIEIPSSVTHIGMYAFYNCESLNEITIPSSVKTIGINAFKGCSSLKRFSIEPLPDDFREYILAICSSLVQNCQLPNFQIDKNTIILDGTFHDIQFRYSKIEKPINLIVLGDFKVGKTSLINKYICQNGENDVSHHVAGQRQINVVIHGHSLHIKIYEAICSGIPGSVDNMYYRYSDCAIIMFDINNVDSFKNVKRHLNVLFGEAGHIPAILIGSKCDLNSNLIGREMIEEIINEYDIKYFEISTFENLNVIESFEYVICEAFQEIYIREIQREIIGENFVQQKRRCNIF